MFVAHSVLLVLIVQKFGCYSVHRAYVKARNGNETETGNGNWKWKLEMELIRKRNTPITGQVQCFLNVLSHYSCIVVNNDYRTGFMSHALPLPLHYAL